MAGEWRRAIATIIILSGFGITGRQQLEQERFYFGLDAESGGLRPEPVEGNFLTKLQSKEIC